MNDEMMKNDWWRRLSSKYGFDRVIGDGKKEKEKYDKNYPLRREVQSSRFVLGSRSTTLTYTSDLTDHFTGEPIPAGNIFRAVYQVGSNLIATEKNCQE